MCDVYDIGSFVFLQVLLYILFMTMRSGDTIIFGNWKMHKHYSDLLLWRDWSGGLPDISTICVGVSVPFTLLRCASDVFGSRSILLGAQDCHPSDSGAHTGDISAPMLSDSGVQFCLVGHSERRGDHGETDELVASKCEACWRAGLLPVVCIGESGDDYTTGKTQDVLSDQLRHSLPCDTDNHIGDIIIAYEPVWAIGTGKTPTLDEITTTHSFIRSQLTDRFGESGGDIPILYGGSVKPDNAASILSLASVDGALIGGASLDVSDFTSIIRSILCN